jgi:hypothetical protein
VGEPGTTRVHIEAKKPKLGDVISTEFVLEIDGYTGGGSRAPTCTYSLDFMSACCYVCVLILLYICARTALYLCASGVWVRAAAGEREHALA